MIGVVENMSGLIQPVTNCAFSVPGQGDVTAKVLEALGAALGVLAADVHVTTDVFHRSSKHPAAEMAAHMGVPFLGALPMDVAMGRACESGERAKFEPAVCTSISPRNRYPNYLF